MQSMIDNYKIWYLGGSPQYEAIVECFFNEDRVGTIRFMKDGVSPPPNQITGQEMQFYYTHDHFSNITTILRHEEPLFMDLDETTNFGWIATRTREPVGESE